MTKIVALVLAGLLFAATRAAAMTGLEFLQEPHNWHVMEPLVIKFVKGGLSQRP